MPHEEIRYSEEAQEILGRIPPWVIRWGVTVILAIFAGIVIGCYFIKYPQTVVAPIEITTLNPPADLMARGTGRIDTLFYAEGDPVASGATVAVLHTPADYRAVLALRDSLEAARYVDSPSLVDAGWVDVDYALGELQGVFLEFHRVCLDYRHYLNTRYIERKQGLLGEQIAKNHQYQSRQQAQHGLLLDDLRLEQAGHGRDSLLFARGVISTAEYEQTRRALLQKQTALKNFEASLTSTELGVLQMEQQLIELSIQRDDETAAYERQLDQARQQLAAQIEQWIYQYTIVSPVAGTITYTNYWSTNQTVQAGERLATVIPTDDMRVIGRLTVPTAGFGKVALGQTVNIKLNGYPYMEYGLLKGSIASLSEVPEAGGYIAEVALPGNLKTTYGKPLALIRRMDGTGEIITVDQRLIQRFLQPVRALFDK